MKLLTTNTKLEKASGGVYIVRGLALAPHSIGGANVCRHSTPGCRSACNLWFAGMTIMDNVRDAMKRRKDLYLNHREDFMAQLEHEIALFKRYSVRHGQTPLLRLNVASDLDWRDFMRNHPDILGYDYSKVLSRVTGDLPQNYELTYSRSERSSAADIRRVLDMGRNVAVVFDVPYRPQLNVFGKLPKYYMGYPVIDGDKHDVRLRSVDGSGVVVGLRLKGTNKARANAIRSGFAVSQDDKCVQETKESQACQDKTVQEVPKEKAT